MPDLLEEIQRQIDARLEELRPFAEEAAHLQRARDALDATASPALRRRSPQRSPRAGASSSPAGSSARLIAHVGANPGCTAGEVAAALGLKRNSVAPRLTRLAKQGKLVKARRGYAVP